MKLQILSDLHNEFYVGGPPDIEPTDADMIILAGDIDFSSMVLAWKNDQSRKQDKPVFHIAGNHEFYGSAFDDRHCIGEVKMLVVPGYRILGTTLWSVVDSPLTQKAMTDYRRIVIGGRKLTITDTTSVHRTAVEWIKNELNTPFRGKTVVVTHHGPSPQCHDHEKYGAPDFMSTAFWTDLEELITPDKCVLWVYGHTHSNLRFTVNGVPVVTNQRGYPGEGVTGFDPQFVIEV